MTSVSVGTGTGARNVSLDLDEAMKWKNVYDGSGYLIYRCLGFPGTELTAPNWQIQKITNDGSGNALTNIYAFTDGAEDAGFHHVATDPSLLVYG